MSEPWDKCRQMMEDIRGRVEPNYTDEYEVGQTVWIHAGGKDNPLHEGKIVHKFKLEGWYYQTHYVVEILTHIDPILEVRNWFSLSPDAVGPINLWRQK